MHLNNQSFPILLRPVLKQNIVTAWEFLMISKNIYPIPKKYVLPSSKHTSSVPEPRQQSDITFLDIQQSCSSSSTTLPMCISSVSSEKGEAIQLQENCKPILLQESSKAILDNNDIHTKN